MLNEIFEKLGLYDLVAVLLSGICIMVMTLIINPFTWKLPLVEILMLESTPIFLLLSYIVGVFFQEIGSLILRRFDRNEKLLKQTIPQEANIEDLDYRISLSKLEKKLLKNVCLKAMSKRQIIDESQMDESQIDENYMYNFSKFYLIEKNKEMQRLDKDQTIAAFSRNLALYFFVLFFLFFLCASNLKFCIWISAEGVSILLAFLMSLRVIRFMKMRYVTIMRRCLYSYNYEELDGDAG